MLTVIVADPVLVCVSVALNESVVLGVVVTVAESLRAIGVGVLVPVTVIVFEGVLLSVG